MRIFNLKIILFSLIFLFSFYGSCSALDLIYPQNNAENISVTASFKWNEVLGSIKYMLDIDEFTQAEDNISPEVCSGGICTFNFLDLSVRNIEYLSSYNWRVVAFDSSQTPINSSNYFKFSTESAPVNPPDDPDDPNNPPNNPPDNPTPPSLSIGLINPLKANSLEEAMNALLNFLFLLAVILAPLIIILAAFIMLTSHGDPAQITKAKSIITWTLIAFAIVLLAKGSVSIIRGALGG